MSWMSLACFFTPPWVKTLTSVRTVCSVCFWCQNCKPVGVFLHRQCSERRACVTHAATGRETVESFILSDEGVPRINVDHILTRQYLLFIRVYSTRLCRQHVNQHESCEITSHWITAQFNAELKQNVSLLADISFPGKCCYDCRHLAKGLGESWCTQGATSDICHTGQNNKS